MDLTQLNLNENVCRPAQKPEIGSNLNDTILSMEGADGSSLAWIDIEQALTEEWEIGGLAMPAAAIRTLVAGE